MASDGELINSQMKEQLKARDAIRPASGLKAREIVDLVLALNTGSTNTVCIERAVRDLLTDYESMFNAGKPCAIKPFRNVYWHDTFQQNHDAPTSGYNCNLQQKEAAPRGVNESMLELPSSPLEVGERAEPEDKIEHLDLLVAIVRLHDLSVLSDSQFIDAARKISRVKLKVN